MSIEFPNFVDVHIFHPPNTVIWTKIINTKSFLFYKMFTILRISIQQFSYTNFQFGTKTKIFLFFSKLS